MSETVFYVLIAAVIAAVVSVSIWDANRKRKRRETLRRDDSGAYVWIDFDGSERRSTKHPEEKGGEWHSEGGAGDGGDGGGGD